MAAVKRDQIPRVTPVEQNCYSNLFIGKGWSAKDWFVNKLPAFDVEVYVGLLLEITIANILIDTL